jgi:hypothetical protein
MPEKSPPPSPDKVVVKMQLVAGRQRCRSSAANAAASRKSLLASTANDESTVMASNRTVILPDAKTVGRVD